MENILYLKEKNAAGNSTLLLKPNFTRKSIYWFIPLMKLNIRVQFIMLSSILEFSLKLDYIPKNHDNQVIYNEKNKFMCICIMNACVKLIRKNYLISKLLHRHI